MKIKINLMLIRKGSDRSQYPPLRNLLGWEPKIDFDALVKDMMEADIELMKKDPSA